MVGSRMISPSICKGRDSDAVSRQVDRLCRGAGFTARVRGSRVSVSRPNLPSEESTAAWKPRSAISPANLVPSVPGPHQLLDPAQYHLNGTVRYPYFTLKGARCRPVKPEPCQFFFDMRNRLRQNHFQFSDGWLANSLPAVFMQPAIGLFTLNCRLHSNSGD